MTTSSTPPTPSTPITIATASYATVFSREPYVPRAQLPNLYLAGPTLRTRRCTYLHGTDELGDDRVCLHCHNDPEFRARSWRADALDLLQALDFRGTVIVPEFRGWREWTDVDSLDYDAQVTWELEGLREVADHVVFWVPRDMVSMPAMTTNIEFGLTMALIPNRVTLGYPVGVPHVRYLDTLVRKFQDKPRVQHTLEDTLKHALEVLEPYAPRAPRTSR